MWCLFFMGALRVNSSLDTWEIECISCEALSLFIQLLCWLMTTLPCLRCLDDFHDCLDSLALYMLDVAHSFHFLIFTEKYVNVCVFVCLSLMSLVLFLALFHDFAQECKRLSVGEFDVSLFSPISYPFLSPFLVLISRNCQINYAVLSFGPFWLILCFNLISGKL